MRACRQTLDQRLIPYIYNLVIARKQHKLTIAFGIILVISAAIVALNLGKNRLQSQMSDAKVREAGLEGLETLDEVIEVLGEPLFAASSIKNGGDSLGVEFREVSHASHETLDAVVVFCTDDELEEAVQEYFDKVLPAGHGFMPAYVPSTERIVAVTIDDFGWVQDVEVFHWVRHVSFFDY